MGAPVLGIDLGTTNSVVACGDGIEVRVLPDDEGNQLVPSVVSFHPSGQVLVGHNARERRLVDARNTIYSVKRLIGRPYDSPEVRRAQERFPFQLCEGPDQSVLVEARGETYSLAEISAFVLREVRRIAEARLGVECTRAVVTVPANFNELQRSATKAAGRVAGLDVLRILNEPTAAALAYGYGRGSRERVAVFDLGGGTFDITILELAGDVFEVVATAGDTFLGGDDIDLLVAEKMADAFLAHHRFDPRADPQAFERVRAAAEWAKCQLSFEAEVQLRVEELAYGAAGVSLDLSFALSRAALEQMSRPLLMRTFEVCEDAMRVAGVRPTQLDNVILVGGSTRIPLVRQMVAEYFSREPLASIDPDLVVARGAALQGAALSAQVEPVAPSQALGRVALKKVSRADLEKNRQALVREMQEERPAQPAFAPARPIVPVWDSAPPPLPESPRAVSDAPPAPTRIDRPPPPPAAMMAAPLLLDVTSHTLGVETMGGYCEPVIARNAAIPVEQTKVFSTGGDGQRSVSVRIVQGESRRLDENQPLGQVELTGLREAPRGEVKISVTFMMDADGTLGVSAKDLETGREEVTRIRLVGGVNEDEIRRMTERQMRVR